MAIGKRFAVFAVCEKSINIYSHKVGPFFYINQFKHCTHLIRIPLESFTQLAANVGDPPPNTKFVLLSNTGRCGSTLLTQLFEQLPNTVAISEPEVLMEFSHNNTFDEFPKAKQSLLLQSCISLLFKSASQSKINKDPSEIDSLVIKPKAHGIYVARDLNALYPNIKNLFMYRHPVEYVKSVRSVYFSLLHPIVRHVMVYAAFDLNMYEFIMRQFGQRFEDPKNAYSKMLATAIKDLDVDHNLEERFAALYCGNMLSIMSMASSGINKVHVVSYHELKEDTQDNMKQILKHCDMQQNSEEGDEKDSLVPHLPENDSQNNSGLSRSRLRSYQTALKDKEILVVDKVLKLCGFPTCDKFPIESNELSDILGTSKAQYNSPTSRLSNPRYISSEPYLKPPMSTKNPLKDMNGGVRSESNDLLKNRTPSIVNNKSLWLPVNRFF